MAATRSRGPTGDVGNFVAPNVYDSLHAATAVDICSLIQAPTLHALAYTVALLMTVVDGALHMYSVNQRYCFGDGG